MTENFIDRLYQERLGCVQLIIKKFGKNKSMRSSWEVIE